MASKCIHTKHAHSSADLWVCDLCATVSWEREGRTKSLLWSMDLWSNDLTMGIKTHADITVATGKISKCCTCLKNNSSSQHHFIKTDPFSEKIPAGTMCILVCFHGHILRIIVFTETEMNHAAVKINCKMLLCTLPCHNIITQTCWNWMADAEIILCG